MTTIRYQLTEPEVIHELLRHRRPPRLRFWARILLVVVGLALLGGSFFAAADAAAFLLLVGGVLLALGAVLLASDPFVVRRAYRREVRRHPGLTEPKETAFDERGLATIAPHVRVEMHWAAVLRLTQDEHYVRLFTEGTPIPLALPKRAFAPDDLAAFLRCHEQAPRHPPPFVALSGDPAAPVADAAVQPPVP